MNVRDVWTRLARRWTGREAVTSALSVCAAVVIGVMWACAPRGAEVPGAPAVVAQGLAAGPVVTAPAAAPEPPARLGPALEAVERELAAGARAAREEETRAAETAAASRAFPVASRMEMRSTAYCLKGHMRTGVRTRDGMAAADPTVLPLGSVVRVTHTDGRLVGIFVIMDTGGAVRGNKLDIYMDSCREASDWGIRRVVAEVLDIGRS